MMKSPLKFVLLGVLILAVCAGVAGFRFYAFLHRPVAPASPVVFTVGAGESFRRVAHDLQDSGVVASAFELRLLARLKGTARRVQAGTYEFREPAVPGTVLARLVSGDVMKVRITIPEGFTLQEIAARVAAAGFGTADGFLALARDRDFLRGLAIDAPSLEGYLYPETYMFAPGVSQRQVAAAMVRELDLHLTPDLLNAAAAVGLDKAELITLASIIQKETGSVAEMGLVSAVFHNRLKRHMPLQSDPTVIYGIPDFDGNLTRKDLETPTAYNTYRIKGLPPGPIASPGEAALRAAAHPAAVDYLYFVARGDGTHVFSSTLRQHDNAVRRYQLRR
jgi:UPF0755 protein